MSRRLKLLLSRRPRQLVRVTPPDGMYVHFVGFLKDKVYPRKMYLCATSGMENILEATSGDITVHARPIHPYKQGSLILTASNSIEELWPSDNRKYPGIYICFSLDGGLAQLYFSINPSEKSPKPFLLIRESIFTFDKGTYDMVHSTVPKLESIVK